MKGLDGAMLVYLGDGGGYQPNGHEERLRQAYGDEAGAFLPAIKAKLDVMMSWPVDWDKESLSQAQARVEAMLAERMPEFSAATRHAMACCFSYHWR
jgi:hypothetical protein